MNRLFSSLFRKVLANTIRRQVHHSAKLFQSKDDKVTDKENKGVCLPNPFCLQVIEPGGSTIRDHNNFRRQRLYEFGLYTAACLPKWVQKIQLQHTDELEVLCAPEGVFQVLSFLRNHQHACFNQLSYLTAIDVPSREYRFEVVYCLNSYRFCERIRVKTYTDELTPLESCSSLWYCGNWFERETYDMFGIVFTNHPDLRRMLTDYGFTGHPLRKDFPQIGYHECRYDDELKKIVYEPIEFSQEQRRYQIECPWVYYRNFHEGYNQPKKEEKKK